MIPLDNSNHSTYYKFDDDYKSKEEKIEPEPKRTSTGRKVRFNHNRDEFYDDNRKPSDIEKTWFKDTDYRRFRVCVKKIISKFRKEAEEDLTKRMFMVILEDLYDTVRSIDFVVKGDVLKILTEEQRHNVLNLFKSCGHEADLIGLEFHVVKRMTLEAQQERENIQEAVADIQHEFDKGLWEADDNYEKELRDSCLNFSQASSLFGQFMALAQLEA